METIFQMKSFEKNYQTNGMVNLVAEVVHSTSITWINLMDRPVR